MNGWTIERMNGRIDEGMVRRMDGWMDDGRKDGWRLEGRIDGWKDS